MADATSVWVWWRRTQPHLNYLLVGCLLLAAGWYLGLRMSPYYASHPIVFEDTECLAGTPEALAQLQDENKLARVQGVATNEPSALPTPSPLASIQPAVFVAPAPSAKTFVGSVNSDKYHHPSCAAAKRISPENEVWFSSEEEAESAGYTASECTKDMLP